MLTFASDAHRQHHPHQPFHDRDGLTAPPEVPERAERIRAAIDAAGLGAACPSDAHGLDPVLRVHTEDYVDFLEHAHGARVAILDVDYHHGNGTQQIFYERDDVCFVSLHADPNDEYPFFLGHADEHGSGRGVGFTRNVPLLIGTAWDAYGPALDAATKEITSFGPDALVVSLGVDTAAEDPDTFQLVQEGGYELTVIGRNVVNVLRGVEDA